VDDDRIVVAGLAGQEEAAARLAASFTDRFAGLVLGSGSLPDFAIRRNLDPLPTLRLRRDRPALPAVTAWLRRVRRDPFPARIDWSIGPLRAEDRAWWILVTLQAANGASGRVRAEIQPENRIRLRTRGVRRLRVLLNDRLVDLDRMVVLHVNEDQIVSRMPTRSVRRVVDAVEALGDRGAVFPEFVDVEIR
jgi:hypothetical protein